MLVVIFWALVGVFILIMGEFFIPAMNELFKGKLFLLPLIVFSLLGGALIVLTLREKVKGRLKKFLLLTGWSALGFFISVFLHNFFYALGMLVGEVVILRWLMEVLHVVFFMVGVVICPLGFIIGVIGSIVWLIKKKRVKWRG